MKYISIFIILACLFVNDALAQPIKLGNVSYEMVLVKKGEIFLDNNTAYCFPDFYIGKTEVTVELWNKIMGWESDPSEDKYPISAVSLADIDEFIGKLNQLTNRKFRLPRSFEWKYVFQEGENFSTTTYSGSNNADSVAWFYDNSGGMLRWVALKEPNALGIYDMSGNVAELCADGFTQEGKSFRFCLGGDFDQNADEFQLSNANIDKGFFDGTLSSSVESVLNGFRLVCDVDSSECFFPTTYLAANPNSLRFSADGGTKILEVLTDGKEWNVSFLPSWCKVEKSAGGLLLEIIAAPNDGDERKDFFKLQSLTEELIIQLSQNAKSATFIEVDNDALSFKNIDEVKTVKINSDGRSWIVISSSDWCQVEKTGSELKIKCADNNQSEARTSRIQIKSASIEKIIEVSQSAGASRLDTDLNRLVFPAHGGEKSITVSTDAEEWTVDAPWWCQIKKTEKGLLVKCLKNTYEPQMGIITLTSGRQRVQIKVSQNAPFNSPQQPKRPLGISAGYVSKQWLYKEPNKVDKQGFWNEYSNVNGFEIGFRFEPLFNYGLGLNTGLFLDIYQSTTKERTAQDENGMFKYRAVFSEGALSLPLHLEYRLHFSKNMSLFVYSGASADMGLYAQVDEYEVGQDEAYFTQENIYGNKDFDFHVKRFNASFDYGLGIRIYGAQLNMGASKGLIDYSPSDNLKIKQNKNIMISLSWMIDN